MIIRTFCIIGLLFASHTLAHAQWTSDEVKGLDAALFVGNLRRDDLGFKRPQSRADLAPFVARALEKPLDGATELMELHAGATADFPTTLRKALNAVYGKESVSASTAPIDVEMPEIVPKEYRDVIGALAKAVLRSSALVRAATENLTADEKRDVIESAPRWMDESPEAKFDFVRRPQTSWSVLMSLVGKVDLPKLRFAARELADAVDAQLPKLKRLSEDAPFTGQIRFTVEKMNCVLAGLGPNEHVDRDAALTIDLGGNDEYRGRCGAGVGYASLAIDLGGSDRYDVPDLSSGAGILGVGLAYDLGGDDVFRGKSLCFGAGIVGVGGFFKFGGDDLYQTRDLSLGSGCFGVGICLDTSGDDQRQCGRYGQGAARTGGLGWLIDLDGEDTYRVRGGEGAFGQGAGVGFADQAVGGVGLLTDLGDNDDAYISGGEGQACGEQFGLGSLFDAGGSDLYWSSSFGPARASSDGFAAQFDLSGNDTYASTATCMASDFGVAILLDRSGDDVYAAREWGPARALANGAAIFVDADGADRYNHRPALATGFRDSGSLALFADLNGPDDYADALEDGHVRSTPNWGVALDEPTHGAASRPEIPTRAAVTPGSKPRPTDPELQALYAEATLTGATAESRAAAFDKLVAIGLPALQWALDAHLKSATGRELEVLGALAQAIGVDGRTQLALRASSPDDAIAHNALLACDGADIAELGPVIVQALQRESLALDAAWAARKLNNLIAVPELMRLCAHKDANVVLAALTALTAMKDPQSVGTGQALLESPNFLIRKSALTMVGQFPTAAMASGRIFIRDADERKARIGCELLAIVGAPEALQELGAALTDARSGVRMQAALGLAGRCPANKRVEFMALKRDPNPTVRAVVALLDAAR